MTVSKIAVALLFCIILGACSSSTQIKSSTENNHYFAKEFSHNQFTTYHKYSVKKPASSDQQLMLSLLNRPMPEDQRMMLAFAERQASYFPNNTLIGVRIKGEKESQSSNSRVRSQYSQAISQDINSVSISVMPK